VRRRCVHHAAWLNFVSSRRERIEAKLARAGLTVPGDDAERIEIPEIPKTVSYP
jgi:hypothetical protein